MTGDQAVAKEIVSGRRWTFDADGAAFKLAAEAKRIQLAHLFDSFTALESSTIQPLPQQIEAVYGPRLPMESLEFLLAVNARPGGFLVAPEVPAVQIEAGVAARRNANGEVEEGDEGEANKGAGRAGGGSTTSGGGPPAIGDCTTKTSLYGQFALDKVRAVRQFEDILQNVVENLALAPGAKVDLILEVNVKSDGFHDRVRRVVSENATQLGAEGEESE